MLHNNIIIYKERERERKCDWYLVMCSSTLKHLAIGNIFNSQCQNRVKINLIEFAYGKGKKGLIFRLRFAQIWHNNLSIYVRAHVRPGTPTRCTQSTCMGVSSLLNRPMR